MRRRQQVAEEMTAEARRKFTVYQKDELRTLDNFNYLDRIIACAYVLQHTSQQT